MATPDGWARVHLGDVLSERGERNPGLEAIPVLSVTKNNGIMLASERFGKQIHGRNLSKYRVAPRDSIVVDPMLLWSGTIGRQKRVDAGLVSPDYRVYEVGEAVDITFMEYAARGHQLMSQFQAGARGTNVRRNRISRSDFLELLLDLPPVPEQRKIAAILSSVDEAIEATRAVIEQVQVVKEGVMQELLSKGLPGRHKEFKQTEIGRLPEQWGVVRLDQACECLDHMRVPIKSADRRAMAGDIPYYGASGVIDYVNDHLFDEDLVLLSEDGANILSRTQPVAFKISGLTWVNNHAHVFRPGPGVDHDFLIEHLESLDYAEYSTGTAQPKLNRKTCNALLVPMPPPDEQARIGEISALVTI